MIKLIGELGRTFIPESIEELPNITEITNLYSDIESTSFDDKVAGLLPYCGHRICGYAFTIDKCEDAWYLPIRHKHKHWNLPIEAVSKYMQNLLDLAECWINHNIKFDAHFKIQDGVDFKDTILRCTLQYAKLIDSERLDYGLKTLGADWLGYKATSRDKVLDYLEAVNSKDYGRIPADILGPYACDDVFMNRELIRFEYRYKPDELNFIWENETKLLPVLFDMEHEGLRVDQNQLLLDKREAIIEMIESSSDIIDLTGSEFTGSNKNLQEIMLQKLQLPVLAWGKPTKSGEVNPSFDADTMKKYLQLPEVVIDPNKTKIVEQITRYKKASQYKSLYLDGWPKVMSDEGKIHSMYNPNVRTGRMSASGPNVTQLNTKSKRLILPEEGESFLTSDGSQIEFRFIAEFLQQPELIKRYIEDPTTDFHQWVADMAHCIRQQGKTLNFAQGFGAGKRRTTKILMGDKQVIAETLQEVEKLIQQGLITQEAKLQTFERICAAKASAIYEAYHSALYNLRGTSKRAEIRCRNDGYIRNMFGRRRHLYRDLFGNVRLYEDKETGRVFDVCHKSFNTAVQGTASDYVKTRMIALSQRYNPYLRAQGIKLSMMCHDQLVWKGPTGFETDPEIRDYIDTVLMDTKPLNLAIPILWDAAHSDVNLKLAN